MTTDNAVLPVSVYLPAGFRTALAEHFTALLAGPEPVLRLRESAPPTRFGKRAWLTVSTEPPLVMVSPIAARGCAPCPECLRVRRLQHGPGPDTATAALWVPGPAVVQAIASLTIGVVYDYVQQGATGRLVQVIHAESGRISAWPVAPVHGCRVCARAGVTTAAGDVLRELRRAATRPARRLTGYLLRGGRRGGRGEVSVSGAVIAERGLAEGQQRGDCHEQA